MTAGLFDSNLERLAISRFLDLVREMFERSDYLLPLAAGQRQFRQDNYSMASAALLEDLFFDALGMFVRENHPRVQLARRTGKELWDYGVDGLLLSHKESIKTTISVWWTAGDRPSGSKAYQPKPELTTFSADHPIVFVYSGHTSFSWSSQSEALTTIAAEDDAPSRTGRMHGSLGTRAITGKDGSPGTTDLVLASHHSDQSLSVERVWRHGDWQELAFSDLWPLLGGPGIGSRDLFLDRRFSDGRQGLGPVAHLAEGSVLKLPEDAILPGIYVLSRESMTDVPMVANNRAHSFEDGATKRLLVEARRDGHFVAFPSWFAHYAVAQPPNLYAKQREQYEALFAARRRDE